MKHISSLLLPSILILSLTACGISQEEHTAVLNENNTLKAELESLSSEKESLFSEKESLQTKYNKLESEYNSIKNDNNSLEKRYNALKNSNNKLQSEYNKLIEENDAEETNPVIETTPAETTTPTETTTLTTRNVSELQFQNTAITEAAKRDMIDWYDYIKDVYIEIDEREKEIKIVVQITSSSDKDTAKMAGEDVARYLASLANWSNSYYDGPNKDDIGGIYHYYTLTLYVDDGLQNFNLYGAKTKIGEKITWN